MNRDLPRTFPGLPAELTPRPAAPSLRARYDAASTSSEDAAHWANVDYFSATGALTATVRATVRAKSRYETANNPYVRGMVETVTNSTIGVGPRLQMLTGDKAADKVVEEQFAIWSRAVNLPSKLRLLCRSGYVVDGEALALAINNPRLPCDVKLDLRPVEAEQLSTPPRPPHSTRTSSTGFGSTPPATRFNTIFTPDTPATFSTRGNSNRNRSKLSLCFTGSAKNGRAKSGAFRNWPLR